MSEVKVRWTQNVAGRYEGAEETVERTAFIDGCLANNRLVILEEVAPPAAPNPAEVFGITETSRNRRLAKSEPFKLSDEVEPAVEAVDGEDRAE